MKLGRKIKYVSIGFIALIIIVCCVIQFVMPYWIICPVRLEAEKHPEKFPSGSKPMYYEVAYQDFNIHADKDIDLVGYLISPQRGKTKAILVMVHGIGSCKEYWLETSEMLAAEGYSSLIFDLRAHGKSSGQYCTFGYYEKEDIKKYIDTLQQVYPNVPIGIYGNSLGGAIAIQAMAADKRIKTGIIECTFDDMRNVIMEYGKHTYGFRIGWLTDWVLGRCKSIANFDPYAVQPYEAAKLIDRPVFFAHGADDDKIPVDFNKHNFDNIACPDKVFITVPNAHHNDFRKTSGEHYDSLVIGFLNKKLL